MIDRKRWAKNDRIFKFLNEIHRVDSPFSEDSKNVIFLQGGLNFGGGTVDVGKLRGNGQRQGHLLLRKSESSQFQKRILAPTLWYQNPCDASIFYMPDQILEKK